MLTPDECFALDQTPPAIVELIRYRLANPAPGGHRHHLLARSLVRYWSKAIGRKITVAQIPVVTVTGPEHYRIHFASALDYQARGSKGRFAAHGLAASLLARFADMSEAEWEHHRNVVKAAMQEMYADPEWQEKIQARSQSTDWQTKNKEAQTRSWAENTLRRINHKNGMQARSNNAEWRANQSAAMTALHADPEWRSKTSSAVKRSWAENPEHRINLTASTQKSWAENTERRANHKAALQALSNDPDWRGKVKAGTQAKHPDVIVTYPDGREATFAGQGEAARALGISHRSVGNHLSGKTTSHRGKLQGYSFRYAA